MDKQKEKEVTPKVGETQKDETKLSTKFKSPLYITTSIEMPEGTLTEGEAFEDTIDRMMFERTALTDTSIPLIYNAEGQEDPAWDIRTDHWELAQDKAEAQLKKRKDFIESMKKGKEEKPEKGEETEVKIEQKGGETAS